jgi:hypothetical protein
VAGYGEAGVDVVDASPPGAAVGVDDNGAPSPIRRCPDGVDVRWTGVSLLSADSEAVGVTAAGADGTSGAGWAERTSGVARRCRTGVCPSIDTGRDEEAPDVERLGSLPGCPGAAGLGVGATAVNRRAGPTGAAEVIRPEFVARCTLTTGRSGSGVGSAARDSTGSGGMARSSGCGCPIRVESNPCITPPGASALT